MIDWVIVDVERFVELVDKLVRLGKQGLGELMQIILVLLVERRE